MNITSGVTDNGTIDIKSDGTYTYTDLDGNNHSGTVKVDYAEHNAMIRYGGCVHLKLLHPFYIFIYLVGTVEQTVLRMSMQMHKGHDKPRFCLL